MFIYTFFFIWSKKGKKMIFQVYEAEFISFLLKYYQNNHKHFLIISKTYLMIIVWYIYVHLIYKTLSDEEDKSMRNIIITLNYQKYIICTLFSTCIENYFTIILYYFVKTYTLTFFKTIELLSSIITRSLTWNGKLQ